MFHPPVDNPLFPLLSCHLVLVKNSAEEGRRREREKGGKREREKGRRREREKGGRGGREKEGRERRVRGREEERGGRWDSKIENSGHCINLGMYGVLLTHEMWSVLPLWNDPFLGEAAWLVDLSVVVPKLCLHLERNFQQRRIK